MLPPLTMAVFFFFFFFCETESELFRRLGWLVVPVLFWQLDTLGNLSIASIQGDFILLLLLIIFQI